MTGLILKSSYIRPGCGAEGYLRYIATRDGVELVTGNGPPSPKQRELIQKLLRDFPDSEQLPEHEVYQQHATVSTASSFIAAAIDDNAHLFRKGEQYLRYVAQRPRSHGLFSSERSVDLDASMETVAHHEGPVWIFICSLRQEDAARLGYDRADSWRSLVLAHQTELAQAMKISPNNVRWRAAFHDEKHHPHIHLMVWSDDPAQGYLTEQGIQQIRSQLTNEIFQDELLSLYQKKDFSYQEVRRTAQSAMARLIRQMRASLCDSPEIEQRMETLVRALETAEGKKVYGYLKKPVKEQVDAIVDELAKLPEVAECYAVWNEMKDAVDSYYTDKPREHLPLSRQKEFRAIQNLVIQEAENIRLGKFSFEDQRMVDEVEEEYDALDMESCWDLVLTYQDAKEILCDPNAPETEKAQQLPVLEQLWEQGFTVAAHQLGKCWRDGLGVLPDDERAELWFRRSAEAGNDFSQYALGKLMQAQKRTTAAVYWYEKAASQGNGWGAYQLGKLYLQGEEVAKDVYRAEKYLTTAAQANNEYAQYALGKLYLSGRDVKRDLDAADYWLTQSARQGNPYAGFLLERMDAGPGLPDVLLAATKLLHHLGDLFRERSVPPAPPLDQRMDRKRRRELQQRRIAMGHKPDDHEETLRQDMGGMTMGW